jgi:homocitrate synthase
MADIRPLAIDDTDSIIRTFHLELQEKQGADGEAAPAAVEATS